MAEEQKQEQSQEAPAKKSKLKIILSALTVVILAGGGAFFYLASAADDNKPAPLATPLYMTLEPFVITLKGTERPHYLQIKMSLMTRDSEAIKLFENYRPLIRNEIVQYLNTLQYDEVRSLEAPEQIRTETLARTHALMQKEELKVLPESVIITNLVIQ